MTESKVGVEAARKALDSLDDYARMAGVDPHGPRGMLERFIAQAAELIEADRRIDFTPLDHLSDSDTCVITVTAGDLRRRAAALAACTPAKSEGR